MISLVRFILKNTDDGDAIIILFVRSKGVVGRTCSVYKRSRPSIMSTSSKGENNGRGETG